MKAEREGIKFGASERANGQERRRRNKKLDPSLLSLAQILKSK